MCIVNSLWWFGNCITIVSVELVWGRGGGVCFLFLRNPSISSSPGHCRRSHFKQVFRCLIGSVHVASSFSRSISAKSASSTCWIMVSHHHNQKLHLDVSIRLERRRGGEVGTVITGDCIQRLHTRVTTDIWSLHQGNSSMVSHQWWISTVLSL